MKKKLIAGNWKMNMAGEESAALVEKIKQLTSSYCADIAVCVPFTEIRTVERLLRGTSIMVGAQNVSWEKRGAFTGEISPEMLHFSGASCVIIGHSERREYFGETDKTVNMRLKNALTFGLKAIVCVGETLQKRERNETESHILQQLDSGLEGLSERDFDSIVIAYEPIWAIGTGRTATAEQAQQVVKLIKNRVRERFSADIRVLYGGSMNAKNAEELLKRDIDGGLIGGASLDAEQFAKIVEIASKLC
jgi:triosephosphate isomerase